MKRCAIQCLLPMSPVNFYRDPAVATWFNRAREDSAHARLV